MTHLGAREYDPDTGRFVSVDPVIDPVDPQQMHGYAYASNSPVTYSDPSGLRDLCGHTGNAECGGGSSPGGGGGGGGGENGPSPEELQEDIEEAQAARERAEALKRKSLLDVIIEQGLAFLLDFFGINDIISCFTKGDVGACVGVLMDSIPFGKIFRAGKAIFKGIHRAFKAYKSWQAMIRYADEAISRANQFIAYTQAKLDEITEALAREKKAGGGTSNAPGCEGNSFTPGTRVLMADGSFKPIEEVEVGDEVVATDPATGQSGPRTVTAEISGTGAKHLVTVTVDTDGEAGAATGTVTATDKHPFWVDQPGRWTDAKDLRLGDLVRTPDGARVRVIDIVAYDAPAIVHNLTVNDLHTYHVLAGDQPVLVHNCAVVDAVHAEAEAVADLPNSQRPQVIEALQVPGNPPIVAYSDGGAGTRRVHPAIRGILDSIPGDQRGKNHGGCGLVQCLTEALDAGLDPTGATAAATVGRTRTNKNFKMLIGPCASCQVLVEHFGIDFRRG